MCDYNPYMRKATKILKKTGRLFVIDLTCFFSVLSISCN